MICFRLSYGTSRDLAREKEEKKATFFQSFNLSLPTLTF